MIKLSSNKVRVRCLECQTENYITLDSFNTDREARSVSYEYEYTCTGDCNCVNCREKLIIELIVFEYPKGFINYSETNEEGCLVPNKPIHDDSTLSLNEVKIAGESPVILTYQKNTPQQDDKFIFGRYLITSWTNFIHKMFLHSFDKKWFETYWVIDMHRTLIKPTYDLNDKSLTYYPFALEVMQILTKRNDIKTIMWTSSYPDEIQEYVKELGKVGVVFDELNENPDISSNNGNFGFYEKKFYFNVLIDDKAAFDPETDWEPIYNLFKLYEEVNFLPDPNWSTKY